jgi:AcrR family transcriptional regulator
MARTGRRPGATDTRERILAAARHRFAEHGLEGTSIRAVAADAGVDPALVHHYFGTKGQLFVAAVELPFDPASLAPMLAAGPIGETGLRFARLFLSIWEDPVTRAPLQGIVRSALSDPGAMAMVRELVITRVFGPVVQALGASQPELRLTLLGSQVIGLALVRYVLRIEPMASLDAQTLIAAVAPTFQRYLVEPLGGEA